MIKVSIIIPTYNRACMIQETIDSILKQTYKEIEVIVVDSASTDNTQEVLKKYGDKIKIIYVDKRQNAAQNRNIGAKEATGDIYLFLDSDDLINTEYVERAIDEFQKSNSDVIFSDYYKFSKHIMNHFDPNGMHQYNMIPSGSFVKREIFEKVGGYDEGLPENEDYDFWLRATESQKVKKIDYPGFWYRISSDSKTHNTVFPTVNHFIQKRHKLNIKRQLKGSVSIVIPVCGQLKYTKKLIKQLNNITYSFGVIVVNNGSVDEAAEILECAEKHLSIQIIQNTNNQGFPRSVNQGLSLSRGEYIFVLNNDIEFEEDLIPYCVDKLNEGWDVISPMMNNGTWYPEVYKKHFGKNPEEETEIKQVHSVSFAFAGFKRNLLEDERVGLLDERFGVGYHEESYWCYLVRKAGYKIGLIPYRKIYHIGGVTTKSLGFDQGELRNQNLQLYNKLINENTIAE